MLKILAIDDNNDNLISLKAIINDMFPGAVVLTSLNGRKGIELAINNNPDVILLDIIMPDMDGFEVCRLLKLDERVNDIPVVFLTALKGDKENRIKALEVGAEGFISKPIDEPELIAQIRAMVKIKAANEQKRNEKERLEKLVEEQTASLKNELKERKKAEKSLRESEERFQLLFNKAPLGYQSLDFDGHFIDVNQQWLDTLGYSREEVIGKWFGDFLSPDYQNGFRERFPLFKSLGQIHSEFVMVHKNRTKLFIAFDGRIGYNIDGGFKQTHCILQDITQKKLAEEEVKKSYDLLNKLTAQVPGVVYQYRLYPDGRSAFPFASPGMYEIYEVTPEEVREDASPVFSRIHPGDYNYIVETITESAQKQTLYHSEFRVILPKQGLRWRMCDAKPELMDDGSTLWYGIITDITERKLAEQRLKESQQLFQGLFNASPDSILLIDPHDPEIPWSIIDCNEAACKMNGYLREEMIGQCIDLLHPIEITREDHDLNLKNIRNTGILRLETFHRHKKGYLFPIEVSTSVINIGGRELVLGIDRDISDRKQAESALREREVQYRNLADSGTALIWTSGEDKLCNYFNQPWLNFTGRTLEQEMGNGWVEGVHPDDADRCIQIYISSFDKHEPFEMEYRLKHISGEYRWLQDMGTPNFNSEGDFVGYIGHCFDITDHKKLEAEIIAAKLKAENNEQEIILKNNELMGRNKFIQTVLDQLPIGIALNKIDEGTATYMNKKFEEIYGWTYDEITSISSFFEHVYPDADYRNKLMEQIMNDIQSGDPERMHWENIFVTRKDGSKRVINAVNIPLIEQNTMVSTVSDITDLHKTQNDLLAAKEKAEESDRLKSAFLANMSHEIRTPLNSIIGFSELMTDPDFNVERQAEFAQMINTSGTNLLAIISDIMDLSKIEAGQIQVNKSRFIVNQLINGLQREYNFKAFEKGIELRLDPNSPSIETYLESDENRIKQVLVNFVGNSIKFTSKGFIEIGFAIFDGFVQFRVIDTGIGIPKNFHGHIFERFGQVDSSSTRKYGGNGLGLAISKSLVEMLGGKIWMESEPGKGSAFYFTIPV